MEWFCVLNFRRKNRYNVINCQCNNKNPPYQNCKFMTQGKVLVLRLGVNCHIVKMNYFLFWAQLSWKPKWSFLISCCLSVFKLFTFSSSFPVVLFTKILMIDFDLKRKCTILFFFTKILTRILNCVWNLSQL